MTKAIVESVTGADYFILNGISRPKSYEAIGVRLLNSKKGVKIVPVQREALILQPTLLFNEYEIDGKIPETQEECISMLNEIVFINLADIVSKTVENYAELLKIKAPSYLAIIRVLNDNNKNFENSIYFIFPDGKRMWLAATVDD